MPYSRSTHCRSPRDDRENDKSEEQYHRELALFLASLNQEQRRLYAAVESNRLGRGGVSQVVEITGMGYPTVARGRRELADLLQGKSIKKERKPIPGRPRIEQQYPAITAALEELLSDEVAGSPEDEHKWVRSSVAKAGQTPEGTGLSGRA